MTKGERFVQRYEILEFVLDIGVWSCFGYGGLNMDMDKEGATLRKRDGSKFLDKRSTQVGGASS